MPLACEWDQRKSHSNLKKHGVSFAEAASVFGDPLAQIFDEPDRSVDEQREIIVGHSSANRPSTGDIQRKGEGPRSHH